MSRSCSSLKPLPHPPHTNNVCLSLSVPLSLLSTNTGCVKFTLPATGWAFKQGVDAYGNDLTNVGANGGDWAKLITACDATPGCRYGPCGQLSLHADSITHNKWQALGSSKRLP